MKAIDQTKFVPDWRSDDCGNCLQACIASLFELPLDEVPHFVHLRDDWMSLLQEWLHERGFYVVRCDAEERRADLHGYSLMFGKSPRGDFQHMVVALAGELIHDPHPTRAGLDDIKGYYLFASLDVARGKVA